MKIEKHERNGLDWYVKWFSSFMVMTAVTLRSSGVPEFHVFDLWCSWIGACGWFAVALLWNDRALIILNGVMGIFLASGLLKYYGMFI